MILSVVPSNNAGGGGIVSCRTDRSGVGYSKLLDPDCVNDRSESSISRSELRVNKGWN